MVRKRYIPRNATEAARKNDSIESKIDEIYERVDFPLCVRPMVRIRGMTRERQKELRDASPPPDGFMYTPDGRLVPIEQMQLSLDDPKAQEIFCQVLEVTGSLRAAADTLGITSLRKVTTFINLNPVFAEEVEAAADRHRQSLYSHAVQRATVGYQVPIIGGKDKDQIVAYERRVSDSLLKLLLQRHFPEFRDASKGAATNVTINQPTVNNISTGPRLKDLPREKRDALRLLLKDDKPEVIDATAIEEPLKDEGGN